MKIYLFDSLVAHQNLLPLSFTRPLADFRCGILTIKEKWQLYYNADYRFFPVLYLQEKFGTVEDPDEDAIFIAGNVLPKKELVDLFLSLKEGEAVSINDMTLFFRGSLNKFLSKNWANVDFNKEIKTIEHNYDIFLYNPDEIISDFNLITHNRKSQPLPDCVRALESPCGNDKNKIFIEEGAVVECATINTKDGPVYIGKNAILMEGAAIRGPFALCDEAEVRMGAKIYEGTTIGPHCKVGGEVSNSVFFGFSNKAHDGYLGNSVIGEWCNIGAGVNASNLKNDYSLIKVWNYRTHSFNKTDLQFCGLTMGDHSKIGVNCMINTATVIGVGVNLHGAGFPRTFLPCFCEGSPSSGFSTVPLKKFLDVVERVMTRRNMKPSEADLNLLKYIYENQ